MRKTVEWQASSGQKIVVTIEAKYGFNLQHYRKTSGRQTVVISATIDGTSVGSDLSIRPVADNPGVVARIENIGLTAENHDRVQSAVSEVRDSIAANNAECDRRERHLDSFSDASAKIANDMSYGE